MILLSELSRRRIRSINKLVRVGRTEIVMVIRVDKEKGTNHNYKNHLLELLYSTRIILSSENIFLVSSC